MTKEELIVEHIKLHKALDRLVACYIDAGLETKGLKNTSVMELVE